MSEHFLVGNKIYLRRLTRDDCGSDYLDMVNDFENLKFIEGLGHRHLGSKDLVDYVTETNQSATDLLLGIFEIGSNAHVGNIHLSNIKPHQRNCIFGIVMRKVYSGKGYAREASYLLSRYAFLEMAINRIHIPVVSTNEAARKLYENLGAVEEGTLRQSFYKDGTFSDLVVYGLLREDFLKDWTPQC